MTIKGSATRTSYGTLICTGTLTSTVLVIMRGLKFSSRILANLVEFTIGIFISDKVFALSSLMTPDRPIRKTPYSLHKACIALKSSSCKKFTLATSITIDELLYTSGLIAIFFSRISLSSSKVPALRVIVVKE